MNVANETLASTSDVYATYADLSATLAKSCDAVLARLNRGVRRLVLTLSAVMVASAAVVVLLAWSAS
jgi:hypothetical protein